MRVNNDKVFKNMIDIITLFNFITYLFVKDVI